MRLFSFSHDDLLNKSGFSMKIIHVSALASVLFLASVSAHAALNHCQLGFAPINPDDIYQVSADGVTVTDLRTRLMWKRCEEGKVWDASVASCVLDLGGAAGVKATFTWAEALAQAESHSFAGYSDWRLPNVKELRSLMETCREAPAINNKVFRGAAFQGEYLWASTPSSYSELGQQSELEYAFAANVNSGSTWSVIRANHLSVRLVRDSDVTKPAKPTPDLHSLNASLQIQTASVSAISDTVAKSYGLEEARDQAPPTELVKASKNYGGVAVVASGSGVMNARAPASFAFTNLAGSKNYDHYFVAEQQGARLLTSLKGPYQLGATAVALIPVSGKCGAVAGRATVAMPSGAGLCAAGSASSVTAQASQYSWTCSGISGGANASCRASRDYSITTSTNGQGTVTCDATQVSAGASVSCTATANQGYKFAGWGGHCSGTVAHCTLSNISANRNVAASFAEFTGQVVTIPEGPLSGAEVLVESIDSSWTLVSVNALTAAEVGGELPNGVSLPHGAIGMTLAGGVPGSSAEVVLTYPEALPAGVAFWKYGPTADKPEPHWYWYAFPNVAIYNNQITLTLTDGGAGDSDGEQNGTIVDPGAPAIGVQSVAAVTGLSQSAMIALTSLLVAGALVQGRRQRGL